MKKPKIIVEVTTIEVKEADPSIEVITINIDRLPNGKNQNGGTWPETFGSVNDAEIFMKGLKVAFTMMGRSDIELPIIPKKRF